MLPGEDKNSEVAIIEFDSRDEAVVAQTRDQKSIDDNTIEVQFGAGATLFVTNFPPTADEAFIRGLFGEVSLSLRDTCCDADMTSMARLLIFGSRR